MRVMGSEPEMEYQPQPGVLAREADVPKAWKTALDRQEDFIEELLGG